MPRKFPWNRRMITSQLSVFFMLIYMLEFLTITGQSSLIVVVLGREWVQTQRLPPVDMILASLGICRFCQLWSSMLHNFGSHFHLNYNFWCFGRAYLRNRNKLTDTQHTCGCQEGGGWERDGVGS